MTTTKLLWGMTWRGGALGLLAGTMLGTFYGAVFANSLFFFGLLAQAPGEFRSDNVPSAIFAAFLMALIGSIIGGIFGIPTGFVVGVLNGLLLGIIARTFFYPLRDAKTYRRVIAPTSAVFTAIASWLGFFAIMLFYANRENANVPALAIGVIVPALIAGIAAAFISQIGARWYEKESAK